MAYQPMTPRLDDISHDLHNLAHAMTYRSPQRLLELADQNEDTIIEVSDDEADSDPPPRLSAVQQSRRQQQPSRGLLASSASAAGASNMEFAAEPALAHPTRVLKRSWTPGSSLSSSPPTAPQGRGKRRANPASPRALVVPPREEAWSGLLPGHHRIRGDGTVLEQAASLPSSDHHTQHKAKSEKKKAAQQPPYYVDGRLDVKMYRGPGYERFPVVLGTVEGQQELCDKWDADHLIRLTRKAARLRQAIRTPYMIHGPDSDSSDDEPEGEEETAFERKCLASVIDVFPDIEHAYVKQKIRDAPAQPQYVDEDDEEIIHIGTPPLAERIITEILEMQSYPKQHPASSIANGKGAADDGTGITITWDRDLPKDKMYTRDAIILLAKHFAHVPAYYITKVVEEKNSIFDSYVTIQGLEDQYYSLQARPYQRRIQPRSGLERKYTPTVGDRRVPAEYANRVNELQAAKQFVAREAIKEAVKKAKEEAEALNLAEHIKTGAIMECQCCFDTETPLNRIVPCMADVPHFFCFTCVESLADNQVGMLKHDMLCMDASGCTAQLSHEDVGRAVPIATFDRLELNKQQAEIIAAKIEGLEQCPCCEYKAICLDVAQEPVFFCQNPECARATCRKCKKDSHIPNTCEENNRDKTLSARHVVEEARSEAIIRTCPQCKAKILKDFGCNKMTCARCGCKMCYVCSADITKLGTNMYSHFGRKCVLYDEYGIDRHENEANEAEKGAITKAKSMDAELDENKLRIDTGKPVGRISALQDHPAADAFLRDLHNRAARLNGRQRHLQTLQARVERLEALRPDPELEEILAGIHAMDGAYGYDHIQELTNLYRRARLNLAQHRLHLDEPLQPPALADRHTPTRNQHSTALNPARNPTVDPPAPFPLTHNYPASTQLAAGFVWPRGNEPNGTNEGLLLGLPHLDFNVAGVQAAIPGPVDSGELADVTRAPRPVVPTPRQLYHLPHPQFFGAPGGGTSYDPLTVDRNIGANAVHPPAGATSPVQGVQTRRSFLVSDTLAPSNSAGNINRHGGRDLRHR